MSAQRGSIGIVTLVAALVVGLAGAGVVTAATGLHLAAATARTAADAAALAGAAASPLAGGDGRSCAWARRLAAANRAELLRCRTAVGDGVPRVEVEVAMAAPAVLSALALPPVRARAAATLRPAGRGRPHSPPVSTPDPGLDR